LGNHVRTKDALGLRKYVELGLQVHEPVVKREPLVAPAGAAGAEVAVNARFSVFAGTSGALTVFLWIARMIVNAVGFLVEWVHEHLHFVPFFSVARAADVEVLVQELLAPVTMHVNIGELFLAKLTDEATVPVSDRIAETKAKIGVSF